jgi:hypothetical protein
MKYTTDQPVTASMHMYMMGVQPSRVMHWKMVSQAYQMLSKCVMPRLGLLALRHIWPTPHVCPGQFREVLVHVCSASVSSSTAAVRLYP